jgi:hypothetical protein
VVQKLLADERHVKRDADGKPYLLDGLRNPGRPFSSSASSWGEADGH